MSDIWKPKAHPRGWLVSRGEEDWGRDSIPMVFPDREMAQTKCDKLNDGEEEDSDDA